MSTPEIERREVATTLPHSEAYDSTTAMSHTGAPLQGAYLMKAVIARRHTLAPTQAEFAARQGISPLTLQNWEQGRLHPTVPAKTLLRYVFHHPRS